MRMNISSPLTMLRGIGEKKAETFARAGIMNLGDLISYYPRRYDVLPDITSADQCAEGREAAVCAFLSKPLSLRYAGSYKILTGTLVCGDITMPVTWFNMPYLKNKILPGRRYVFMGQIRKKGSRLSIIQPRVYAPEEYERLRGCCQSVYSLTGGLTDQALRKAIDEALRQLDLSDDYLPECFLQDYALSSLEEAIRKVHQPLNLEEVLPARRRLVFDEFLFFILGVKQLRESDKTRKTNCRISSGDYPARIEQSLSYTLTDAQKRVWKELQADLTGERAMTRLIQGDVGSGKTILAFMSMALAGQSGYQSAMMVPTEVLARQHFDAFCALMRQSGLPLEAVLLTGSMKAAQKREALEKIADGSAAVVIGTHALFQEKVSFQNLALVVTDEQHRFGVRQRGALGEKGLQPHTLVMSATPIPRTLAVILYADLDISVIDQMPAGRKPVKNCVVDTSFRPAAYRFIEREVRAGHQAYVICAMVEESDQLEAENVLDYAQTLRTQLPEDITIGCLHGRMKPEEKNTVMQQFASGEIRVLVSTTVVEVGVNVPAATVMMVEDAQRFGLAQLHQLRGRVGRSDEQSYCIFINSSDKEEAKQRLDILGRSNDGFEIARMDLKMRGPGNLFGIRQSGNMDFLLADIYADADILQQAAEAAGRIICKDAGLKDSMMLQLRKKYLIDDSVNNGIINI